ncbi:MAG: tyrosine-type recombinase/integrase [Mycobacterium sp.]
MSTTGGTIEQNDAKTRLSARTLVLPPHLMPILLRTRREQLRNRAAAGSKWEGPRDGFVVAQREGTPPSPRTLNAWWNRSLLHAEVAHRRLHASRHTAATLLHLRGAPIATIAAWLGHADGVLAMRTPRRSRWPMPRRCWRSGWAGSRCDGVSCGLAGSRSGTE